MTEQCVCVCLLSWTRFFVTLSLLLFFLLLLLLLLPLVQNRHSEVLQECYDTTVIKLGRRVVELFEQLKVGSSLFGQVVGLELVGQALCLKNILRKRACNRRDTTLDKLHMSCACTWEGSMPRLVGIL